MANENTGENIAETLARVLPDATTVALTTDHTVHLLTMPAGMKHELIDLEKFGEAPRRKTGAPTFSAAISFTDYVRRHATPGTVVWCSFNPQTFALRFTAVLDDYTTQAPAWRGHRAVFEPDMSAEWKLWKSRDGKPMPQVEFAEFIETNASDIASDEKTVALGYPTDLQMLEMATNFVANEERALKSSVRLQSGGVRLTYVADPDAGTTANMEMFAKFALGIPVFQGGGAWGLFARLKYRTPQGKVSFHYELIRPDRVHELAAKQLIEDVTSSLGDVPLLMGSFS